MDKREEEQQRCGKWHEGGQKRKEREFFKMNRRTTRSEVVEILSYDEKKKEPTGRSCVESETSTGVFFV